LYLLIDASAEVVKTTDLNFAILACARLTNRNLTFTVFAGIKRLDVSF
jgi:hypothetical protein